MPQSMFAVTCLLIAPTGLGEFQFGGFAPQVQYEAGPNPTAIATADLNGNGVLDIVVTNSATDTISVLLGLGNGTFAPPQTVETWSTPWSNVVRSVALGDVNGNCVVDMVVTDWTYAYVLLGNGDGTFGKPMTLDTKMGHSASATLGDLNGNGHLDVAIRMDWGHTVEINLGNGDGTFQYPYPVLWPIVAPAAHTLADLTGDGVLDMVVTTPNPSHSGQPSKAIVLLNNGDGTFIHSGEYEFISPWPFLQPYSHPNAVAAASLNDIFHWPMIATTHVDDDVVSVLMGEGDGQFNAPESLPVGEAPLDVAIGTFRVNEQIVVSDLVVANSADGTVSILLGNGLGAFEPQLTYAVGDTPMALSVGDFNGNGIDDIAVANSGSGTVSILLNLTDPLPIPGDLNGDGVVDVSDLLVLLGAWGPCPRGNECPADLNDDGTVDVFDLLVLLANWG